MGRIRIVCTVFWHIRCPIPAIAPTPLNVIIAHLLIGAIRFLDIVVVVCFYVILFCVDVNFSSIRLRIQVVGGDLIQEVLYLVAGVTDQTNRIDRCAIGILSGISLSNRSVSNILVKPPVGGVSRITIREHNHDPLTGFSCIRIGCKDTIRHLHAKFRMCTTIGIKLIDRCC